MFVFVVCPNGLGFDGAGVLAPKSDPPVGLPNNEVDIGADAFLTVAL